MTRDEVKQRVSCQPFVPFVVVMDDGERFAAAGRENVMVTKGSLFVSWYTDPPKTSDDLPDRFTFCSYSRIASLEPTTPR